VLPLLCPLLILTGRELLLCVQSDESTRTSLPLSNATKHTSFSSSKNTRARLSRVNATKETSALLSAQLSYSAACLLIIYLNPHATKRTAHHGGRQRAVSCPRRVERNPPGCCFSRRRRPVTLSAFEGWRSRGMAHLKTIPNALIQPCRVRGGGGFLFAGVSRRNPLASARGKRKKLRRSFVEGSKKEAGREREGMTTTRRR